MSSVFERPHLRHFPFAAIIGMDAAKRALLLLAIDPRLKGVLISSAPGSAKSLLASAFWPLLPPFDFPGESHARPVPHAIIPLNATEDRLLGSIDLERTLSTGKPSHSAGLLAMANGGLLRVEDINLLGANISDLIAAALDAEMVRVEREGMSITNEARFVLVGTYNAQEGEVSPNLRERAGLIANVGAEASTDELVEIMSRSIRYEKDPDGFIEEFAIETATLKEAIAEARKQLSGVRLASDDIKRIAQAALSLAVEGNRADVFAARAARANAALAGRNFVNDEDIIVAIQLALLPRATRLPATNAESEPAADSAQDETQDQPGEKNEFDNEFDSAPDKKPRAIEDLMIEALDALPPEAIIYDLTHKSNDARSGSNGESVDHGKGKYYRSSAKAGRSKRLAIDATLRAAAAHQAIRRGQASVFIPPSQSDSQRLAPQSSHRRGKRIRIAANDLRYKRFKSKSGILFILAIDASGSMALNRMAQAKGAVTRLLQQAYLRRDKVALISFRRSEADTLLAPTRSVELARQLVDAIPTGGATPIAIAIEKALELARLARLKGMSRAMLILLTDGRSNVGLGRDTTDSSAHAASVIDGELERLGAALQRANVASVVIDTKPSFVSNGEGRKLAAMLGGRYLYLPRADSAVIYNTIERVADQARDIN